MGSWDAVVVGGRVAGASSAMLLARAGQRVLLVERSRFGTDTVCTSFLQPPAIGSLRRWGLLDQLRATGCPAIRSLRTGGQRRPLMPTTYAPRRAVLDQLLVRAASESGVEVRERFSVSDLVRAEDGRVVGITGHRSEDRREVTEAATWVIGADGVGSTVSRRAEAPAYETRGSLGASWHAYFSGVELKGFLFGPGFGAAPTNDGLVSVFVGVPAEDTATFRVDPEPAFLEALQRAEPTFGAAVSRGRRETRFFVATELPAWFRRPWGDGWALVGDAGFRQWPNTGHGITDAFRDAELLAEALTASDPVQALRSYEAARNASAIDLFEAVHGPTSAPELDGLARHGGGYQAALMAEAARGQPRLADTSRRSTLRQRLRGRIARWAASAGGWLPSVGGGRGSGGRA